MTQEEYERRVTEMREQIMGRAAASRGPYPNAAEASIGPTTPEAEEKAERLNTPTAKTIRYVRRTAEATPRAVSKAAGQVMAADRAATEYVLRALNQAPKGTVQSAIETTGYVADPEGVAIATGDFARREWARREGLRKAREEWKPPTNDNPYSPTEPPQLNYSVDAMNRAAARLMEILKSPEALGDVLGTAGVRGATAKVLKDTNLDEWALAGKVGYELLSKDYAEHPQSWEKLWGDVKEAPAMVEGKIKKAMGPTRKLPKVLKAMSAGTGSGASIY
jgi:hypothetical protein